MLAAAYLGKSHPVNPIPVDHITMRNETGLDPWRAINTQAHCGPNTTRFSIIQYGRRRRGTHELGSSYRSSLWDCC